MSEIEYPKDRESLIEQASSAGWSYDGLVDTDDGEKHLFVEVWCEPGEFGPRKLWMTDEAMDCGKVAIGIDHCVSKKAAARSDR